MESVFDYENHFSYLQDRLRGAGSRGIKGRFAEFTRMQPAFLSQVLAEKYPLSLEQADLANTFLEHNLEESDFFILVVSRDRAGSASLKRYYSKKIELFRKRRMEVVERLGRKIEISAATQGVYYSSWIYAAVHVALTVPSLRKLNSLRDYLGVSREKLLDVLQFLETHQLVEKKEDEFYPTQNWIRIDRGSPQVVKLHTNWRSKAIQSLDCEREGDLHFSGVYSLDKKTASLIRDALIECISKQVKRIEAAPEKELYVMNLDFFDLRRADSE